MGHKYAETDSKIGIFQSNIGRTTFFTHCTCQKVKKRSKVYFPNKDIYVALYKNLTL